LSIGAPAITIDNDENENDAWTECRELFEPNQSHMLNPSIVNNKNYLLRHSSANTSLNESSSLDALAGNACTSIDANHDDIFSIIEQAGITFGKLKIPFFKNFFFFSFRSINWIIIK
jgi:hypothetical protein